MDDTDAGGAAGSATAGFSAAADVGAGGGGAGASDLRVNTSIVNAFNFSKVLFALFRKCHLIK
ncbi:MAG: hypothetical protein LBJ81_01405 [Puniceicoccales bacterium]|nr:hypothetical protein [Puniceicoccales bacterium]